MPEKINDHNELSFPSRGSFVPSGRDLRRRNIYGLLAFCYADQIILRAESGGTGRRFPISFSMQRLPRPNVAGVTQQKSSLAVIGQVGIQNLPPYPLAEKFIAQRDQHLNALVEIPRHPVRAS